MVPCEEGLEKTAEVLNKRPWVRRACRLGGAHGPESRYFLDLQPGRAWRANVRLPDAGGGIGQERPGRGRPVQNFPEQGNCKSKEGDQANVLYLI